jgi:excisionase family DNA binding protein
MPADESPPIPPRPAGSPWPRRGAAQFLNVSERHLARLIEQGKVRAIRIGTRVLIPDDEVHRIAEQGTGARD